MASQGDIAELQKRIMEFVDARDWRQFHNLKDCALSLSLEAAEVLEHFQWKDEQEVKAYIKKHSEEIGEELVDVLYWVLLIAFYADIDLKKQFEKKMEKNEKKYPVEKAKSKANKYTDYLQSARRAMLRI